MATYKVKFICNKCKTNSVEMYYVVGEHLDNFIDRLCYHCGWSRFYREGYEPRKKKDISRTRRS